MTLCPPYVCSINSQKQGQSNFFSSFFICCSITAGPSAIVLQLKKKNISAASAQLCTQGVGKKKKGPERKEERVRCGSSFAHVLRLFSHLLWQGGRWRVPRKPGPAWWRRRPARARGKRNYEQQPRGRMTSPRMECSLAASGGASITVKPELLVFGWPTDFYTRRQITAMEMAATEPGRPPDLSRSCLHRCLRHRWPDQHNVLCVLPSSHWPGNWYTVTGNLEFSFSCTAC